LLIFQTGLRISEALSLTPVKISQFEGKPVIDVIGKGKKPRLVSCPESLAKKLMTYAYHKKLNSQDRFFPFNRIRGWQIINEAAKKGRIWKKSFPSSFKAFGCSREIKANGKSQGFTAPFRPLIDFYGNEVSFYFNSGRLFKDPTKSGI
jgi:integrase